MSADKRALDAGTRLTCTAGHHVATTKRSFELGDRIMAEDFALTEHAHEVRNANPVAGMEGSPSHAGVERGSAGWVRFTPKRDGCRHSESSDVSVALSI